MTHGKSGNIKRKKKKKSQDVNCKLELHSGNVSLQGLSAFLDVRLPALSIESLSELNEQLIKIYPSSYGFFFFLPCAHKALYIKPKKKYKEEYTHMHTYLWLCVGIYACACMPPYLQKQTKTYFYICQASFFLNS